MTLTLLIAGCATTPPNNDQFLPPQKMPVMPSQPEPSQDGLIFSPTQHVSLFQDHRFWRKGDLVTINVTQNATASTNETTQHGHTASTDSSVGAFLGVPLTFGSYNGTAFQPTFKTNSDNQFKGKGQLERSNAVKSRVTAVVTRVLNNNVLAISGQTNVNIGGEVRAIRISGYVSARDIGPDNVVSSDKLADMTVQYVGQGPSNNAQKTPWFQNLLNKYSPF